MQVEYQLAPVQWPQWAARATAADFKTISIMQLSTAPGLATIPEGAEYTFGTMSEKRETCAIATYGKGLNFTRQMFINDDLQVFTRILPRMAQKAKYLEDDVAVAILTANAALADAVALFHATHANYVASGSGGAPTITTLAAGEAAIRIQKDLDAATVLNLVPKSLIVPAAIGVVAKTLVASPVDPAKYNNTPNIYQGALTVVVEPRLDASSTVGWYLAADPALCDTVQVIFLESEPEPIVEQEEDFNTDTMKFKVRHNIVAKAIDYRGMYMNYGS
jgi:hypothetical protein